MTKISPELEIRPWGSDRVVVLATTEEASKWATKEREFWDTPQIDAVAQQLKPYWSAQINTFSVISNAITGFEHVVQDASATEQQRESARQTLAAQTNKHLENIRNGRVLTSEHPAANDIHSLASRDITAATILLVASYSNARDIFNSFLNSGHYPHEVVAKAALASKSPPEFDEAFEFHRKNLAELANSATSEVNALRDTHEQLARDLASFQDAELQKSKGRSEKWELLTQQIEDEWKSRLKVYDEKMALAAPTTYWRSRAKASMFGAIAYGIVFVVTIGVALWKFEQYAIPYLTKSAIPGVPILTAVLPVIIPAFAVVWILRILGRLLAESMQLMQDAKERATMVMTFLALMNDEVRGKTLVTDDDRLLILHSLFRPSAISATDDSPPVNWFDILSRKFGGPDKK